MSKVRRVELHEYEKARDTLVKAFTEDECAEYLTNCDGNTPEQRAKLDKDIFEYIVYAHLLKGLVLTVGDWEGIACWMPPGQNMDDMWTIMRSGMWRLNYKLGKESRVRYFNEFLPKLHDGKAQVLKERDNNSWYLIYIGTVPEARGKGYSRMLVEYVTAMADKNNEPCYLESSSAANLPIYKRFGFEPKAELYLTRGEKPVELHLMVREPHVTKDDSDD